MVVCGMKTGEKELFIFGGKHHQDESSLNHLQGSTILATHRKSTVEPFTSLLCIEFIIHGARINR
jgi:hypothetical protein